jgi:5-methylcytosine-specific restriction endonuclease McrA
MHAERFGDLLSWRVAEFPPDELRLLMPTRAPMHVPAGGADRSNRSASQRNPYAAGRPSDPFYHTKVWQQLRKRVMIRDLYVCQIKLPGCTVLASVADHIVPREQGGTDLEDNLRAACARCHNARHNADRRVAGQ